MTDNNVDFENYDFSKPHKKEDSILDNKNILYIHNNENNNVNKMYSFFKEFRIKEVFMREEINVAINKYNFNKVEFVIIEDTFFKYNINEKIEKLKENIPLNKIIILYKSIKFDILNTLLFSNINNIIFNTNIELKPEFKKMVGKLLEENKNNEVINENTSNNTNIEIIVDNNNNIDNLTYILNYQENLIFIIENNEIVLCNNSLLSFFGKRNLNDIKEDKDFFNSLFLKDNGYIYSDDESTWLEKIIDIYNKNKDFKVKMYDKFNSTEKVFLLKVTMIPSLNEKLLIDLTDISKTIEIQEYYEEKAYVDNLTKVYNRQKLNLELSRLTKRKTSYSILFFDIDFFKKINDTYGHDTGDEVLKKFANIINYSIRKGDILGRWGGEEFIAILPNANGEKSLEIADRLRLIIQNTIFENIKQVTTSIGASTLNNFDTRREDVIKRADDALYMSKKNGRNQVTYI